MESLVTYENVYKSLCRVCLKHQNEDNMIPLLDFTKPDGLSCFGKAVVTFASVDIQSDDVFPNSMCKDCLHCLKQAIYFKLKCEASDKQLKKLANFSASKREIKEKVVEYAMFKSYFTNEDLQETIASDIKCESETQIHLQKVEGNEKLYVEVAVSYDSFSDNIDSNEPDASCINGKSTDFNEDGDAILDRIEQLIGLNADDLQKEIDQRRQMQLRNTEAEKFICNICQKVLANKRYLEHHMQRHYGFKYVCQHCGKGFPVNAEMRKHQVAVHGIGPYLQCQQCPYKAPRKFNLIEHERIHTGERPYACDKCGLTFRRRFLWKKHHIYHKEKTIQCNLCPRKFYLRSALLSHCNNVHERMYVYACNKCGVTYANPATVRRHLIKKHGVPRESQGKVIRINKEKRNSE